MVKAARLCGLGRCGHFQYFHLGQRDNGGDKVQSYCQVAGLALDPFTGVTYVVKLSDKTYQQICCLNDKSSCSVMNGLPPGVYGLYRV